MRPHLRPNVKVANDFSIDHLLIHDATVHRYSKARLPGGGFKESWNPVKDIRCRFTVPPKQAFRKATDIEEQKELFSANYKVFTLYEEEILRGDRISFLGKIYEVVAEPLNPSFLNHHLEVEVRLVPREV